MSVTQQWHWWVLWYNGWYQCPSRIDDSSLVVCSLHTANPDWIKRRTYYSIDSQHPVRTSMLRRWVDNCRIGHRPRRKRMHYFCFRVPYATIDIILLKDAILLPFLFFLQIPPLCQGTKPCQSFLELPSPLFWWCSVFSKENWQMRIARCLELPALYHQEPCSPKEKDEKLSKEEVQWRLHVARQNSLNSPSSKTSSSSFGYVVTYDLHLEWGWL